MEFLYNNPTIASNQFLFDKQRTGRTRFPIGNLKPEIEWGFNIRSYPPKAPESAPVFDLDGNLYFGCHDGCIYSINNNGELRWFFNTDKKVYSSPLITSDQEIVIIGGDGYAYKFSRNGDLIWVYDTSDGYRRKTKKQIFNRLLTLHKSYDFDQRRLWTMRSWSSPSISTESVIYLTGYGKGLHAVNLDSGLAEWTYDLGSPRFHLSGVALDKYENIYVCSQQSFVHCLNPAGKLIWKTKLKSRFDIWGNPSVDPDTGIVYVSSSFREREAIVYAISPQGEVLWNTKVDGGIRGSISISYENYVVVGTLKGYIYFIDKKSGSIQYQNKFSNAVRALWTTASIDPNGCILFTTKDSNNTGSLICLNKDGKLNWKLDDIGKTLSVPVVDNQGMIYIGTWKGKLLCLRT